MNLVPLFCICLILQNNYLLCLALNRKRRYNNGKENVHQSNKVVEAMGKATVYCIMHTERCVAQVSTAGECKIYFEDFMPYGLVLTESNDFDTRINNVITTIMVIPCLCCCTTVRTCTGGGRYSGRPCFRVLYRPRQPNFQIVCSTAIQSSSAFRKEPFPQSLSSCA